MSRSFSAAPPSTRSGEVSAGVLLIATRRSHTSNAIPSSVARATCAAVVPRVRPVILPRAPWSQYGAPSPASAGTNATPSDDSTFARERLDVRRFLDDAEPVAQPLHGGAGDEGAALERVRHRLLPSRCAATRRW